MKRVFLCLVLVVLVLPCLGCELGTLVSNPDAAQAFITGRIDMISGMVADWMLYAELLSAQLATVLPAAG